MNHPTKNKSLSQKTVWHLKVLAGAIFISFIFSLILHQSLIQAGLPLMLVLTFVQLEIFIWLGHWFFESVKTDSNNFRKQMVMRLLLFYIAVLIIAFLLFLIVFSITAYLNNENFSGSLQNLWNYEMRGFISATLIGFAIGALFFFYVQWTDALKREQKLNQEKLIFQYETLKKQVNPHFLFNSLNSLSSLVRKDPELSEKFIQKLSSIYRYVLDVEEKELVLLSDELIFVRDYFYLQQIRDQEKIVLKTEIREMENAEIPPVSIQLLVENALKHNSATRNQPLEIIVHDEGLDKIAVRNNLQKKRQLSNSAQIGLKNLNERCRLILNREIEVQETRNEFVVKLPVKVI